MVLTAILCDSNYQICISSPYTSSKLQTYIYIPNLTFPFGCLKDISMILCLKLISLFPQSFSRSHTWIHPKTNIPSSLQLCNSLSSVKVTTMRHDHQKHAQLFLVSHPLYPKYLQVLLVLHPKCIPDLSTLPNVIQVTSITHCSSILSGVCASSPHLSIISTWKSL